MKKAILFFFVSGYFFLAAAQDGLTPTQQAVQRDLIGNFEKTGYGDYEIDLLHRKIGLLIPRLQKFIETSSNGEKVLRIEVTMGESTRPDGQHYLIHGYSLLFPGEDGKLKKVELNYLRDKMAGNTYQKEKRILTNPTPDFIGDGKVDSNMDIRLSLYITEKTESDYKLIREVTFGNIDRHDRKKRLLDAYKQYLRKTLRALEQQIRMIELNEATEFLFMLEFE